MPDEPDDPGPTDGSDREPTDSSGVDAEHDDAPSADENDTPSPDTTDSDGDEDTNTDSVDGADTDEHDPEDDDSNEEDRSSVSDEKEDEDDDTGSTTTGQDDEDDSTADQDDEDSEIPVLDGSNADDPEEDSSGGLTKIDDSPTPSGGPSPGSGPDDPSNETPPGAPPSDPTNGSSTDDSPGPSLGAPPSEPTVDPSESSRDRSDSDPDIGGNSEWTSTPPSDPDAPAGHPEDGVGSSDGDTSLSGGSVGPIEDGSDADPGCEAAPPDEESGLSAGSAGGDSSLTSGPGPTPAGAGAGGGAAPASPVDDAEPTGPPDDEEMPLTEHIEEMISRLAVVAVIAAGVAVLSYPLSGDVIVQMWYYIHPGEAATCMTEPLNPAHGCAPPHVYGPLEFILTKLKFSGLVGLVVAIPFAVYQTYLFMRPGLYPSERRYYLASVPLSLVLALLGISFAFLVVLPLLFRYFMEYTSETVNVAFQLSDTIDLMLVLMGWTALIFQIPLFMTLAVMMGITTREWMASKRIYFWGGFGGLAFFFVAVDPTGMAPILLTITMIVLFEVTLKLLEWTRG